MTRLVSPLLLAERYSAAVASLVVSLRPQIEHLTSLYGDLGCADGLKAT